MEHLKASASPIPYSGDGWFDPLEAAVRFQVRAFIETMVEAELLAALGGRDRYQRKGAPKGYRNGHRDRQLVGTFGQQRVSLPRARLIEESGGEREWHSQTIRAYKRVTKQAEALIAQVYLAGTNTRRVRRALASLFGGAVSKDTVSRAWRKVQGDWAAWQARDLSQEDIVRLILDGTGVKVRLRTSASPRSRCWWLSGFAGTARRCFSRSGTWAGRRKPPGDLCWTTFSPVV